MDIKSLMSKLESISSMTKVSEAGDPDAYAQALAAQDRLEKAAQYTGDDPIVRSRMGLPAKLPPIEQWDGKMPEAGKGDWLTRNVLARGASKDVQAANTTNQQVAGAAADQKASLDPKLKQIQDLTAKLTAPATTAESIKVNVAKNIVESFGYSVYEADAPATAPAGQPASSFAGAAGQTAPAAGGTDKASMIKQLQALLDDPQIAGIEDDPQISPIKQAAYDAIKKAGEADKAAQAANVAGAGAASDAQVNQKLAKFKELLAKAGQKPTPPGTKPAPEIPLSFQKPAAPAPTAENVVSEDDSILAMIRSIKV